MKTDARVRYTKMRIREAFFDCLAQKPVSKITVKELCDAAEINRATFYKHYTDPFDLLQKMEEEALAELEQTLNRNGGWGIKQLLAVWGGDKASHCALLASSNGDPGFSAQLSTLFYRQFRPSISQRLGQRTEQEQTAAYLFVVGGCGQLIACWNEAGRREPMDEMVARINAMCDAFLRGYGAN